MMYSHYYLVLTLVSIVGLALPSDHESSVMTQRKIAKGSKKNPSLLFHEEVRVSLVAPKEIEMPDLKAKLAEVVLGILNEERRGLVEFTDLDPLRKKIYSFAVQITRMTEIECVEKYSNVVRCHKAIVMIESKEDFKDRFSKLKELLGNVLERYGIVVTPVNKGHYPYVAVTNKTPYDTSGYNIVIYTGWGISCSDDRFDDGAPSGQTWSATSRGFCLVKTIRARLTLHDGSVDNSISRSLVCDDYKSSGTSYSQFYIIMNGDNGCCVQSDHQSGVCPPTDDCVWCSDNTNLCCRWNNGDWNAGCPGCPSSRPKGDCVLCKDGNNCCYSSAGTSTSGGWNSACPGCAF